MGVAGMVVFKPITGKAGQLKIWQSMGIGRQNKSENPWNLKTYDNIQLCGYYHDSARSYLQWAKPINPN